MHLLTSWVGRRINPATVEGVEAFSLGRRGLTARVLKHAVMVLVTLAAACGSKTPDASDDHRPRGGSSGIGGGAGMGAMAGLGGAAGSAAGAPAGAGGLAGSAAAGMSGAAGGAACAVGQTSCNGVCATTATDAMNCGACGTVCQAGSQCVAGVCQVTCGTGQTLCAGACKTIVSDPANCGACGVACPAVCAAGVCAADCGLLQSCEGVGGAIECADVMTNPSHCGACGAACGPGLSCVAGSCVLSCATGQTACGGRCVDTMTSAANCGACGTACPAGTPCIAGFCGCPTGQTLCNGACVDTTNSAANCGACGVACPVGQACELGACRVGCSTGLTLCGGSCVNTADTEAHCGTCNAACPSAQSCVSGTCQCPTVGTTLCASACVNTTTDTANCGACGTACFTGQTCTAGACACPAGQTACNNACVNTQTSNDHCGACGEACGGASTCVAGVCTCPMGQTLCADLCVDTEVSGTHCGGCGMACATGQTCSAGVCSGAGGVGADGCTGGIARNIAVSRIDAFQTVAVGIMEDGEEVATADRNTDLVAGRDTVFRVFVTPASGWTTREISARVTIVDGTTSEEFFAKKSVSGASSEGDTGSTFQVTVPLAQIKTTSTYHVELVECSTTPPSGSATTPRFPLSGDAALGARDTGILKIAMVPFLCNTRLPDTTEVGLEPYKAIMDAMYPVQGVEFTVTSQISTGYPVDWNDALDAVRSKRQQDGPAADIYYYGLLKCTDTFQQFCGNGCTAGIGFVGSANQAQSRASMGIAFTGSQAPATLAHEIGHNHGRNHAPCVPQGGSISGVDGNFPYDGANIGVWGFDKRTDMLIDPGDGVTDIMGYCNNKWISDYTYDGLVNRVVAVSGQASIYVNPDVLDRFRVLLLDAVGPRWGRPIAELAPPHGTAEVAEMLDADDNVLEYAVVYRTEVPDINAWSIMVPEPKRGWVKVRLAGTRALAFK